MPVARRLPPSQSARVNAIDLSADVGEGFDDTELVPLLTSVNVSCGGHAGSWPAIRATLARARDLGLAIGAHPSLPDREGFGRRLTTRDPAAIAALVEAQIRALADAAARLGSALTHVKPHGALYDFCLWDRDLAGTLCAAIARVDSRLALVAPAGSPAIEVAHASGLASIAEAFADRAYRADGRLVSRTEPGALLLDATRVAARAVALARGEPIPTHDGAMLRLAPATLCLHGDTPDAPALARAVRDALVAAAIVPRRALPARA